MRITQKAKEENRNKILKIAARLFSELGYEKTTTRDLSNAMGMAKGTLFNYFPSKDTLAMTMVADAMEEGRAMYLKRKTGEESLTEEMFLFIASELRALKSFRSYIGPVLESSMSVFSKNSSCQAGERARMAHLQTISDILANHDYELVDGSITITMYWSLYLGILAHWSRDTSGHQQETLALLDYSMKVFAMSISGEIHESQDY